MLPAAQMPAATLRSKLLTVLLLLLLLFHLFHAGSSLFYTCADQNPC
jgi:hypothetical protein